jgi:CubicO group peptidase (beta-lactamase class C family)
MSVFNFSNFKDYFKKVTHINYSRLSIFAISVFIINTSFSSCNLFNNNSNEITDSIEIYNLPAATKIPATDKLYTACDSWYNTFLKNSGFNGGMIVSKSGNIVFERYQGSAHFQKKDTINANTPLHIASTSKTFTAMAVLKLWEDKLLNLDDEYSKYFPGFNFPGVTIRTLLNHRSGLPNYVYFMDQLGWNKKVFVDNQDVLNCLINRKSELEKIEKPNRHFTYCNTNFVLLALLIEKITNTTYPEYLKKVIFDPLQMKNTFVYSNTDSAKTNPSYDWRGQEAAFINLDKVFGDKNIFSTPQDLLKWDRLLSTNQFLSEGTLNEAYKPYSNEKAGIRNYGLGWRMYIFPDGYKIIYHNGWWHGSNAVFIRLIKEDATIIVIGNKYNRNIYKARDLISILSQSKNITSADEGE